jgi:hypothetical protein
MPKFVVFFSFKPETVAAMLESPDNARAHRLRRHRAAARTSEGAAFAIPAAGKDARPLT